MVIESDFDRVRQNGVESDSPEMLQNIEGVVNAIFSNETMRLRTVIKPGRQLVVLARLHLFADKYKSNVAADIAAYLEELSVGVNGRGRDDMTESLKAILTGFNAPQESEPERRSLMSKLLGR